MPQSKSASALEMKARRSDLLRNFLLTFNFYVGFLNVKVTVTCVNIDCNALTI